jgi:D-tyrosyl-tRNA(Tyr) deacylase
MRVVIQRVSEASVSIGGAKKSSIGNGLLILLGIEDSDGQADIDWLCAKISNLRVFPDDEGVMNLSVKDVEGELMVVSQFTLHASTKKGNRPSYIKASKPDIAIPLYENFLATLEKETGTEVKTGEFGAMMDIELVNTGPVTIIIDSKNRE